MQPTAIINSILPVQINGVALLFRQEQGVAGDGAYSRTLGMPVLQDTPSHTQSVKYSSISNTRQRWIQNCPGNLDLKSAWPSSAWPKMKDVQYPKMYFVLRQWRAWIEYFYEIDCWWCIIISDTQAHLTTLDIHNDKSVNILYHAINESWCLCFRGSIWKYLAVI